MAKGKAKGLVNELTSTRGMMRVGAYTAIGIATLMWLQKRAADASKKDTLVNKVAGTLGLTGPGIAS